MIRMRIPARMATSGVMWAAVTTMNDPRRLGQHWLGLKGAAGATRLTGRTKNAQQALKF
jgi:hypothetical protein